MSKDNKTAIRYIIYFFIIMSAGFFWIGYPNAPFKDFVLENTLSPVFSAFIVLSWTRFRVGKDFKDKFDYFAVMILMFFVLVCMIGQTYQHLSWEVAFGNTCTVIVTNFDKILNIFIMPLLVGFFIDRFVSRLEKFEQN